MGIDYVGLDLLQASKCVNASAEEGECKTLMLGRLKVVFNEKQKKISSQKHGLPLDVYSGYSEDLLKAIGCTSVSSLDYSDFEGADMIWNMNTSVKDSKQSSHLTNKYNLILDYGTTEHVFNATQSIANSTMMLKIGGRLNLILPVCGSLDHGMYQFSPNWFYSMNSEWLELERFYLYVNQQKNHHCIIWDGLSEEFKKHIDGTFDGSYQANLLQFTHEQIYSFAIFKKKKELDEKKFIQDTHQLIYAKYWEKGRTQEEVSLTDKVKIFIEKKFPPIMKSWIYKVMINSSVISTAKVSPI